MRRFFLALILLFAGPALAQIHGTISGTGTFSGASSPTLAFTALAGAAVSSTTPGSGTYTVAAPSGLTSATWGGGCSGASTVSAFTASGGVWNATFTTPASGGSGCTLNVTGTGSNTASATSPGVTISGGGITLTGITLSGTSFASGAASGTAIGTVGVTATGGSFSGSLSITGTNASSFQLVGTTLETQGSLACTSYSINLVATQAGATGSPYTQPETITCSGGGGVTITGLSLAHVAQGNITSGTAVNPNASTFYFSGPCTAGTTIATAVPTTTGGSFTGSYSLSGTNASSFTFSGANLQCNTTVAGGASYSFNVIATQSGATGSPYTQAISTYAGQTYYISATGSDANNGLSSGAPWLTPQHTVHCGDFVLAAASTSYNANNFASFSGSQWPNATCPGNDNAVIVKCVTLSACKFSTYTTYGCMAITGNYWHIENFECTGSTASGGVSFLAQPTTSTTYVHHVGFSNDVCGGANNSTILSCFQTNAWNGGPSQNVASVDYIVMIGDLAYDGASGGTTNHICGSGISWAGTGDSDTNAGTHDYLAYSVSWANFDGADCGNSGTYSTDGEGWILDTTGLNSPQGQVVAENNLMVGNGGSGIEAFTNPCCTPTAGHILPLTIRYNTVAGNSMDANRGVGQSQDIYINDLTNNYMNANVTYNISLSTLAAMPFIYFGSTHDSIWALGESGIYAAASVIDANWIYGQGQPTPRQNILNWNGITGQTYAYQCLSGTPPANPGAASNSSVCPNTTQADPVFTGASYFTGSISGTTLSVPGTVTGAPLAIGMQLGGNGAYGSTVAQKTYITGGSGTSWTVSVSQTVASQALTAIPIAGQPSCGAAADTLACEATFIAAYKPTATGSSTAGAVNTSGTLGNSACDAKNTTQYILNIARTLPADMDPCG